MSNYRYVIDEEKLYKYITGLRWSELDITSMPISGGLASLVLDQKNAPQAIKEGKQ